MINEINIACTEFNSNNEMDFYIVNVLSLDDVIRLRNFLTSEIERVQQPVMQAAKRYDDEQRKLLNKNNLMSTETKDFWVECNVCHQRLKNHVGSTPCCGSIAYLVNEDGTVSNNYTLFGFVNGGNIEQLVIKDKKIGNGR